MGIRSSSLQEDKDFNISSICFMFNYIAMHTDKEPPIHPAR